MSLEGLPVTTASDLSAIIDTTGWDARGLNAFKVNDGSNYSTLQMYNESVPVGSARREFAKGGFSITVLDPNGEGTCQPRLVATASLKMTILNSTSAPHGAPFTSSTASSADILLLGATVAELFHNKAVIPAAA
ncbi:hypothetical protein MMARV_C020P2 [viral metagenome]|uniref:Uncharacterized protein n=1 Tax=viral metagenome TaxID=1070528 RepID=A0A6L2ZL38_9ZZZZ